MGRIDAAPDLRPSDLTLATQVANDVGVVCLCRGQDVFVRHIFGDTYRQRLLVEHAMSQAHLIALTFHKLEKELNPRVLNGQTGLDTDDTRHGNPFRSENKCILIVFFFSRQV